MRRRAGLVLLAFAVFFAALSPLLRWYAFPRLAKVPPNQYQEVVLEASPATLLDYSTLKARKVEKVTIVQTLKGNVEESEKIERSAGRDVVVWDALSYIQGPDGKMVSEIPERYIFDAHTQAPVNATGEMVDGDPVRREGIEYKWPFLTEKRDYEYFDAQSRTTAPIHYKGTRTFRGLEVYYFEQTIPWTEVPMPKKMPIEGITAEQIAQTGMTRWYTTKRMFWVDPVTGAPVNGEEIHKEELRNAKKMGMSEDTVTAFSGHVKMREDYIVDTVDLVKSQRVLVLLLTSYLPWGFLGLGIGLLALALWLEARARTPRQGPTTA
ncbi:DUF3068 domain-containing protein [Streptomyces anulatus]|uniref:DUF3068 domain-containing protein n=1 Tax=Streptomyces TaxID=1883 RepID=UPI0006FF8A70|nr:MULTISPECIES: DUF3068 domain-containing protein [Streptomyces]KQX28050.1 hypothetical protein ASD29_22865 [Streptomyces sp. Root1295]KRA49082.1 hypothetical protein ASD97_00920 [Streptomyces sp. Root63]WSR75134.1 DUF3068 domain-containing protein [Streptomyces anulatus]WTC70405.1 DUF3068 domain-containing protein [Streptomyces anulatus]GGY19800.1 hypothetical protein GCM10010342_01890 [Streptomyces anulatus]